jgi:hypothetical protein
MRSMFRSALVALMAALALGAVVAAASASAALPEVTIVKGGAYPLRVESSQPTRSAKISGVSEISSCVGVNTKGEINERGKAMSLTLELQSCEVGGKGTKCTTSGAEGGREVYPGSGSLVYINKYKGEVGLLFTLNATTMVCGALEEGVKGSILIPVTPTNTQTGELAYVITGNGSGKATYTKYENEKGESKTAKLEVNSGAGYKEAALEAESLDPAVQEGKELEILAALPPTSTEFVLGEGETFPDALTYSSAGASARITDPVETLTCEGIASKGSITGAKAMSLTIELKHCHNAKGIECKKEGGEAGVMSFSGSASPVYVSKSEKLAGALFTLTAAEFLCGAEEVSVRGNMVDPVTPVDTKTSTLDLSLQGNGKGKPTHTTYENEKGEVVKVKFETNFGSGYKEGALEATSESLALSASEALTLTA